MIDLLQPAIALRKSLLAREFSSVELLEAVLARIAAENPRLNAIVGLDEAAANHAAAAAVIADARIARGAPRPLEGLPISIKDAFDVAGLVCTAGAPALKARVPDTDASAVSRLRRAGAIILAKTNVPVFSGDFQTYNPVYGTTNNPWNLARSPGGSSGGAAAAVAAGLSPFELGSDLAGSIRWPAHACGLFGLKTTWNLVSTNGHIPPPPQKRLQRNPELMVAGPLARSAADLELVLDIIAGPRSPTAYRPPLMPARKISPKGLRVAVWCKDSFARVDSSVARAVEEAARRLAGEGAIVDETARPAFRFEEAFEVFAVLNHAIVAYSLPNKVRDKLAGSAKSFRRGDLSHRALQARGARITPGDYNEISGRRLLLKRKWAGFFKQYDVVLCPPAPVGAIPHDHSADIHARLIMVNGKPRPYLDLMHWAALATSADLPASIAPLMIGDDELPYGVQIIAAAFEDRTAIAVAGMIEALTCGFKRPPL